MKVAVIIVNFNTKALLKNCLVSLNKKWQNVFDTWVVDNGSNDGSIEMIKLEFPKINLIQNDANLGFAAANNLVLKKDGYDYFILLNSDTKVLDDSLDKLIYSMEELNFGVASCTLLNPDNTFQPNAGDLPSIGSLFFWLSNLDDMIKIDLPSFHQMSANYYKESREVGWVSGSIMAIKKKVIEKVGGLDNEIFMYAEDVDFCIKAKRAGFRIGWIKGAEIIHIGGGSSKDKFLKQWVGEFKGLKYLVEKYYNIPTQIISICMIYFFILVRILAFLIVGKFSASLTYAKVAISI